MTQKADIALIRRAIEQRWPLSKARRAKLISKLCDIVEKNKSPRAVISAARAILAADSLNLANEKREEPAEPPGLVSVNVVNNVNNLINAPLSADDLHAAAALVGMAGLGVSKDGGAKSVDSSAAALERPPS